MDSFSEDLYQRAIKCVTRDFFEPRVISNLIRPILIERMIELLLGEGWKYVGEDWSGWDIEHEKSKFRIEVKQSAARQTWTDRKSLGGRLTKGSFDIRPRTGYFGEEAEFVEMPGRPAHLYIFAWQGIGDKNVVDHRDITQWEFYLIAAKDLPSTQKTIGLPSLQRRCRSVRYDSLLAAVQTKMDELEL